MTAHTKPATDSITVMYHCWKMGGTISGAGVVVVKDELDVVVGGNVVALVDEGGANMSFCFLFCFLFIIFDDLIFLFFARF